MSLKKFERSAGRASKTVDALIGIAHCENILGVAGQLLQDFYLSEVRILKFVYQNEFGAGSFSFQQRRIFRKKLMGPLDHVAEGAEIVLAQHALDRFKDELNFVAAPASFFFGEFFGLFRFADTRYRQLAAVYALYVGPILRRFD